MMKSLLPAGACLVPLFAGCASSPRDLDADVASIYADAALDEVRNPVVVIHGILGSRLEQREGARVVWGAFTGSSVDPGEPGGAKTVGLPLEASAQVTAGEWIDDGVVATGPLESIDLDLVVSVVEVDVYKNIIRTLGVGGYRDVVATPPDELRYADDHYTCHTFFYDWRQDNVLNAQRLGRFLRETRSQIEVSAQARVQRLRASGDEEQSVQADRLQEWLDRGVKFDIVAHSMGGLVSRYYLRYGEEPLVGSASSEASLPEVTWAGAELIDRLFLVGTPSFGSMFAMTRLTEGFRPAPILPRYGPGVLGTMPSIYQLLPRTRHRVTLDAAGAPRDDIDLLDPELWIENRWGLCGDAAAANRADMMPNATEAERLAAAEAFTRASLERARLFHAALDRRAATPSPARISLVAGDVLPTLQRARFVTGDDGLLQPVFDGPDTVGPGDGTVPRYSALADERFSGTGPRRRIDSPVPWDRVTFLADEHVGLTQNTEFRNNLLFQLLEEPLDPR